MIERTTSEFEVMLDPNDDEAPAEMQAMLSRMCKFAPELSLEWERVGRRFEITMKTVWSP